MDAPAASRIEERHRVELVADMILVRAAAERFSRRMGFDPDRCREIAIAVSELASNIVKYASPGTITLRSIDSEPVRLEIVAEDAGPGIADIETAIKEFHTAHGPVFTLDGYVRPLREGLGCGLAAVKRLTDHLSITSIPGQGTRVIAIKYLPRRKTTRTPSRYAL